MKINIMNPTNHTKRLESNSRHRNIALNRCMYSNKYINDVKTICTLRNTKPRSKSNIINNTNIQFILIKQLKNNQDNIIPTIICNAIINPKLNPTPYKRNKSPDNKSKNTNSSPKNVSKKFDYYVTLCIKNKIAHFSLMMRNLFYHLLIF